MPDVLRSYGMTCRSPDGTAEWIVCEPASSPFLTPAGILLRFNSESEMELALAASGTHVQTLHENDVVPFRRSAWAHTLRMRRRSEAEQADLADSGRVVFRKIPRNVKDDIEDDAVVLTEIPYLGQYRAWRRRDNWPVAVCGSPEEALLRLQVLGYEQVSVFPNGNSLWRQARPGQKQGQSFQENP